MTNFGAGDFDALLKQMRQLKLVAESVLDPEVIKRYELHPTVWVARGQAFVIDLRGSAGDLWGTLKNPCAAERLVVINADDLRDLRAEGWSELDIL